MDFGSMLKRTALRMGRRAALKGSKKDEAAATAKARRVGRNGVYMTPILHGDGDLDNLFLNRVLHELCFVVDIQLAHEVELMRLHRLHAQLETAGDLLHRVAF